nr:hypothetical protein Iba_chr15cCG9090 [Ipomoea batatas]
MVKENKDRKYQTAVVPHCPGRNGERGALLREPPEVAATEDPATLNCCRNFAPLPSPALRVEAYIDANWEEVEKSLIRAAEVDVKDFKNLDKGLLKCVMPLS